MSVNPVSQSAPAVVSPHQNQAQQKPAATPAPQNDTVHLSSQAKAAAGDVDHDGDSH
jgi:hypothetical protein